MTTHPVSPIVERRSDDDHTVSNGYPTYEAAAATLEQIVYLLGDNLGHVGKLVGVRGYNNTYRFRSGLRRPSPIILYRMICLLYIKIRYGIQPFHIQYIDWEKGQAYLDDGNQVGIVKKGKGSRRKLVNISNSGRREL